jgi:S1-C subfamily serine protease
MRWLLPYLLAWVTPAHAAGLAEVAAQVKPAVVHLAILDATGEPRGNGTGFFISDDGLIVTNHHVIESAHGIRATRASGEKIDVAGVLAQDAARDIAILKAPGDGYPYLTLGSSRGLTDGVEVVVIGSPMGLSWTTSSGIVSAIREDGVPEALKATPRESGPLIQITAAISPGSSGSPVVTLDRMVVGVARSLVTGDSLNFAVPVEVVQDLAAVIPRDAEPRPFRAFPWRNLVGSLGFFAALGVAFGVGRRIARRRGKLRVVRH